MVSKVIYNSENKLLFNGLLFVVATLPWLYGGEIVWQYLAFAFLIFLMAAACFIGFHFEKNLNNLEYIETKYAILALRIPLLLFIAWVVISFLYAIEIPFILVKWLSPEIITTFENTQLFDIKEFQKFAALSVAPGTSVIEALKYSSYLSIFLLTIFALKSKQRVLTLVTFLFITSAIIAVYSLVNYYSAGSITIVTPLPPWDFYSNETIHGTFSYKNHYASYLTLTIPLGMGLIYDLREKEKYTSALLKPLHFMLSRRGLFLLLAVIMLVVLLENSSRAGNGALFLSVLCTAVYLLILKMKRITYKQVTVFIGYLFIVSILVLTTGVADKLTSRFKNDGQSGREHLRSTAIRIIEDFPLVGSGPGTYPLLHKQYKPPLLSGSIMWQRVHNDYLELLSSNGIIGFILLGSTIFILMAKLARNLKVAAGPLFGIQVACLCSTSSILIHSLLDFNFQLPVNALYFFVILAIGLKINHLKRKRPIQ